MTHSIYDDATFNFLIRLKACNVYWFHTLIRCSRKSAKLSRQCIREMAVYVPAIKDYGPLVSVFQICSAVNSGRLHETVFDEIISSGLWTTYLNERIAKTKSMMKDDPLMFSKR